MTSATKDPPPSQVAGCVFCKIIRGETSAQIVDERPSLLTFLDSRPVFLGHCLVVPRAHHETLLDVPVDFLGELFAEVQRVAGALERGLGAEGTLVAVNNRVSQSVPHVHVHVVPRRKKDGLRGFFWPRQSYENEDAARATSAAIRAALL
jgi:histidine triad (HIT) family protein